MALYRNAGYPQSDERCTKGFEALKKEIGLRPEEGGAFRRAYLILKRHGEELCKSARPRCEECPISDECRYYLEMRRDR